MKKWCGVWAVILLLGSGCASHEPVATGEAQKIVPTEKGYIDFEGIVVYNTASGGYYAIQAGDQRFDPFILPKNYCKNGLKVKIKAHLRDTPSPRGWGRMIQVVSIEPVEQADKDAMKKDMKSTKEKRE